MFHSSVSDMTENDVLQIRQDQDCYTVQVNTRVNAYQNYSYIPISLKYRA